MSESFLGAGYVKTDLAAGGVGVHGRASSPDGFPLEPSQGKVRRRGRSAALMTPVDAARYAGLASPLDALKYEKTTTLHGLAGTNHQPDPHHLQTHITVLI